MADEARDDSDFSWLPARCVAIQTIGLHDKPEELGSEVEQFEATRFVESEFILRENQTLALLSDPDTYYLSFQDTSTNAVFELTCRPIKGRDNQAGLSCLNQPPQDILMLNRESKRFTRAAVGNWTFSTASDLQTGASLFIEHGQCNSIEPVEYKPLDQLVDLSVEESSTDSEAE